MIYDETVFDEEMEAEAQRAPTSWVGQVWGEALPQPRPRAALIRPRDPLKRPFVQVYDPADAKAWKSAVAAQVIESRDLSMPWAGPLALSLVFYFLRPKSLPKRVTRHAKRPDVDNLAKAVLDALRSIAYQDDGQITKLEVEKRYGEKPGVSIALRRLPE